VGATDGWEEAPTHGCSGQLAIKPGLKLQFSLNLLTAWIRRSSLRLLTGRYVFFRGVFIVLTKSESTVAKILAAAQSLFLARNYADVTMSQMAEAAEVTKGALYHHFASKEELYLALLHTDLEQKRALFQAAIDSESGCRERLSALTSAFFHLDREQRDLIRLVRRDINVFDGAARAELIRAYQTALPELVEQVLRDGIRDGEIQPEDPRLLSWHFVALVDVTLSAYADTVFEDTGRKLDHVLALFFSGARRSSNGVDR